MTYGPASLDHLTDNVFRLGRRIVSQRSNVQLISLKLKKKISIITLQIFLYQNNCRIFYFELIWTFLLCNTRYHSLNRRRWLRRSFLIKRFPFFNVFEPFLYMSFVSCFCYKTIVKTQGRFFKRKNHDC